MEFDQRHIYSLTHKYISFRSEISQNGIGVHVCLKLYLSITLCMLLTGPRSAVGNVSGYRCVSDCRSRGREFDPGPVPYFRGD